MPVRWPLAALVAVVALLGAPTVASAAETLVVDDDGGQCPGAVESIQAAVDAASDGDTIYVCEGEYLEGESGDENAVDIDKSLTIAGAGADLVTVRPHPDLGDIAGATDFSLLFADRGHVLSIKDDADVDVSGLTVDPGAASVDSGIAFLSGRGSLTDVRVTGTVRTALESGTSGAAVVAAGAPADDARVTIRRTQIERYGIAGIAASGPLVGSLTLAVEDSRIRGIGRQDDFDQAGIGGQGLSLELSVDRSLVAENSSAGIDLSVVNGSMVSASGSAFQGNGIGVRCQLSVGDCDARNNWWGDPAGAAEGDGAEGADTLDHLQAPPEIFTAPGAPPFAPPTASVTAPAPNALLEHGEAATVAANATSGFPVARVEFFRGDESLGEPDDTAPYSATYTPTKEQAGTSQALTAVVTDGLGRTARNTVAVRIADAPPTVSIDSPLNGATIPRTGATTIEATAKDDVGVRSVTFRKGTTVLAIDTTAPYTASYTPTAAEAGSGQALIATATDTSGQTATAAIGVQVEAPPAPQPPPQTPQQAAPPEDRPPTVAFTSPAEGASIDPRFVPRLSADASDDRGVARVAFLNNGQLVCDDDMPPYDCPWQPSGDDVGRNTLIAIAVDGAGQTAVDFRRVRVGKFSPRLSARTTPRRDRKRPYRYASSGSVVLPAGVDPEQACDGGTVQVQFKAGKLKVPMSAPVRPDCTFRTSIAFPSRRPLGKGRLVVSARFGGNDVLRPARAKSQRVRAG